MEKCKRYQELPEQDKEVIRDLIQKRIVRKSNVADILIEDSDLSEYLFKVTVWKYNSKRGWATIGYVRRLLDKSFKLSFNPRTHRGETSHAGRTGSYC